MLWSGRAGPISSNHDLFDKIRMCKEICRIKIKRDWIKLEGRRVTKSLPKDQIDDFGGMNVNDSIGKFIDQGPGSPKTTIITCLIVCL